MDGAFLLLVLFGVLLFWVFAVWVVLGGVPIMPLAGGMGTLDMLGSNFSWKLILMGICLMDGVAGWRRLVVDKSSGTLYWALAD
ncbi:MAG: hypothetical protein NTU72_04125 [Fimbriimonadales bacterium]|nr:hypothetical protein [Fimbriimonadales bacterium]